MTIPTLVKPQTWTYLNCIFTIWLPHEYAAIPFPLKQDWVKSLYAIPQISYRKMVSTSEEYFSRGLRMILTWIHPNVMRSLLSITSNISSSFRAVQESEVPSCFGITMWVIVKACWAWKKKNTKKIKESKEQCLLSINANLYVTFFPD